VNRKKGFRGRLARATEPIRQRDVGIALISCAVGAVVSAYLAQPAPTIERVSLAFAKGAPVVNQGVDATCGGTISSEPEDVKAAELLVSAACEYLSPEGIWSTTKEPTADFCERCTSQAEEYVVTCSDLGEGRWVIRAKIDGYFHEGGERYELPAKLSTTRILECLS
jgi:hypothetical protein